MCRLDLLPPGLLTAMWQRQHQLLLCHTGHLATQGGQRAGWALDSPDPGLGAEPPRSRFPAPVPCTPHSIRPPSQRSPGPGFHRQPLSSCPHSPHRGPRLMSHSPGLHLSLLTASQAPPSSNAWGLSQPSPHFPHTSPPIHRQILPPAVSSCSLSSSPALSPQPPGSTRDFRLFDDNVVSLLVPSL